MALLFSLKQNKTQNLLGKPYNPFPKTITFNAKNRKTFVMGQTTDLFRLLHHLQWSV